VITWPPASRDRFARTGIDHAAVIARVIARALHVPARSMLMRADTRAQTGRDAAARRRGPVLRATKCADALTVLVIDDIATTGGTLTSVARTLRASGAATVIAATIARTPGPGGASPDHAYTFATSESVAAQGKHGRRRSR
jgi:predicted amidophosphoribosyltransferase